MAGYGIFKLALGLFLSTIIALTAAQVELRPATGSPTYAKWHAPTTIQKRNPPKCTADGIMGILRRNREIIVPFCSRYLSITDITVKATVVSGVGT